MKTALICIGDELLKGSVVNTNMAFIGSRMLELGEILTCSIEVADTEEAILSALEKAFEHAEIVITSGGLGPTADDVTKECIARRLKRPLEQNGEAAVNIVRHWRMRSTKEEMPPRIMNQALVPAGAEVINNRRGTAPGLILKTPADDRFPNRTIIMLPGPPNELEGMFDEEVMPYLAKCGASGVKSRLFHVCGLGESFVEEMMLPVINAHHALSAAYCASFQFVKLFLTSRDSATLDSATREVRKIFAGKLLADDSDSLAAEVLMLLRKRNARLSLAESCTGGLLSKLITDVPGCSDVYYGSVTCYDNSAKMALLGVSEETLARYGAVSAECASELVKGASERFGTEAAISITGIAGPGGGTPEKPVGLVYAGVKYLDRTEVFELHLRRSREQIRERAAGQALDKLRLILKGDL